MAEFLCILTDLVSLHFAVLFCFDSLRPGSAVASPLSSSNAWDRQVYDSDSISPRLANDGDDGWEGSDEDVRSGSTGNARTQGDWCLELSSSCRLQFLPFHISYSIERCAPSSERGRLSEQGASLPSTKSNSSVQGDSTWAEVDSSKECVERGAEQHLQCRGRSSEREREMCAESDRDSDREKESKSDTDNGACEYVQQYGAYLNLDLVAACCSLKELPLALDCVLLVSGADQQLDTLSSSLGASQNLRHERDSSCCIDTENIDEGIGVTAIRYFYLNL